MKSNNLITTSALILAGIALTQISASAQTASEGDLILGFQVTDSTTPGNTTNLEVDLGSSSYFTGLENTGDVVNLNVGTGVVDGGLGGLSVTDLNSTYGSSWDTRSDLEFGIAGTVGAPSKGTFLSSTASTLPVGGQEAFYSSVQNLYAGFDGGTLATGATAVTEATGTAGSWTYDVTNNGGNATGNDFGTGYSVEEVVSNTGSTSLELFDVTKTSAKEVGTFVLGSNGSLNFDATGTPQEAPEPSTYMLFGLGAAALLFMRRRMKA